jgi:hypothetical protein
MIMQKKILLEKQSSAITLSDMEIFVFPELMYSLLLANLMSPRIWRWRDDPWFDGLQKMKPYRRITRLKQFIMDHYAFNLDLDTWGLTTQIREVERFKMVLDPETLAQSNALFGYEGDKYYFDIDIRAHFGLDKYDGDTIPYWKTETVEAMDAFRFKPGYAMGAGECVSLSALYAAALHVVARIPLADIFLLATPLHSQNFIDLEDGILTNNRRLVTKKMWFNGTALSAQARRALENEQVTIVAHESGHIHRIYPRATIDPAAFDRMGARLRSFLVIGLTAEIIGNFLRHHRDLQKCFQLRWTLGGVEKYLPLEGAFAYENGCSFLVTDETREKLMAEVEPEEFSTTRFKSRIVLNDLEAYIRENRVDLEKAEDIQLLKKQFVCECLREEMAMESLIRFCRVVPQLPEAVAKTFVAGIEPLNLKVGMTREEIMARLESIRDRNPVADLAFYAYRDLTRVPPEPFLLAARERNPVFLKDTRDWSADQLRARLDELVAESIYDENGRLAQPDEVWNYRRGDGVEKALLYGVFLVRRKMAAGVQLTIEGGRAKIQAGDFSAEWPTGKGLPDQIWNLDGG